MSPLGQWLGQRQSHLVNQLFGADCYGTYPGVREVEPKDAGDIK